MNPKMLTSHFRLNWDLDNWQKHGFSSYAEAEYWQRSCGGILSLKAGIDYLLARNDKGFSPAIAEYIKIGVSLGAYTRRYGWSQEGMVRVAENMGLEAELHREVDVEEVKNILARGSVVIAMIENEPLEVSSTLSNLDCAYGCLTIIGVERDERGLAGFSYIKSSLEKERVNYGFVAMSDFSNCFKGLAVELKNDLRKVG